MCPSGRIYCVNLFFHIMPVHFMLVFLLALLAFLDLFLHILLGLRFEFGDLLWVQHVLLGGGFVQDLDTFIAVSAGSHLQGSAEVIVQSKYIGTEVDQKRNAMDMTIASGVVERSVPPDVTFVRITSEKENSTQ